MFCPKVHNKSVILAGVHRAVQRGRIMDLPGDWRDSGRRESLRRGVPRRNPGRQPDADGGEQDRGGPDDRPRDARVAPPAHGSRSWWGLVLGGEVIRVCRQASTPMSILLSLCLGPCQSRDTYHTGPEHIPFCLCRAERQFFHSPCMWHILLAREGP